MSLDAYHHVAKAPADGAPLVFTFHGTGGDEQQFTGLIAGILPAAGIVRLSDDKSKIGIRIGMTLGTVGFGVLISNPIAGAIVYPGNDWLGLISWCGALLFASSFCLVASRVSKAGWGLTTVI